MNIKIFPGKLSGNIAAIDSKSHAHRLLIALAMAYLYDTSDQEFPVDAYRDTACKIITDISEDLSATIGCLESLLTEDDPHLYCGESGSTLRFLLPLALTARRGAVFLGKGRLAQRPLAPLDSELIRHGAVIKRPGSHSSDHRESPLYRQASSKRSSLYRDVSSQELDLQFICRAFLPDGRILTGGDYELPGHISSQYITGLLMALPLCCEDSRVIVTSKLQSRSYIDITLCVLRDFGIEITVEEAIRDLPVYHIKGGQRYTIPCSEYDICGSNPSKMNVHIRPEGDWSNAAFWLTANALGSDVHISGLNDASPQGDRAIAEILDFFRARISDPSKIDPFENDFSKDDALVIDAGNIPDLVPIISVIASLSPGQTRIINAGRLRIKESDRLKTTHAMLSALGADISETDDGLIINGRPSLDGGTVDGAGDHRIVMAAAIAATCCSDPVTIRGAQAAAKSYPGFFDHYRQSGGIITVTES